MTQSSLWQTQQNTSDFAELCNALYEREIQVLALMADPSMALMQRRLKSIPYYVQKTAYRMLAVSSPLALDIQNATWSTKQQKTKPYLNLTNDEIWQWYENTSLSVGLIVPIAVKERIVLDSIDKIILTPKLRFRTNVYGWFEQTELGNAERFLLKPNKKIMMAACAGHCWRENGASRPKIPTLRELLLSCNINWRNFRQRTPVSTDNSG